jgi:hypothetical protein
MSRTVPFERGYMPERWPPDFQFFDKGKLMSDMLHLRMQQTSAEVEKNLRTSLYSDEPDQPLPKKSLCEWLSDLKWRVHCAWLVLRGHADIC